jgi:hypothetical protein
MRKFNYCKKIKSGGYSEKIEKIISWRFCHILNKIKFCLKMLINL